MLFLGLKQLIFQILIVLFKKKIFLFIQNINKYHNFTILNIENLSNIK